jgi:phosphoglycerate dehydrogenase-like enzyme
MTPRIAILPHDNDGLRVDVAAAGGVVGGPEDADGIIWTDPRSAGELGSILKASPARWVQLPFAGIEPFFAAGVVDSSHVWTCAKGIYGHSTAEHALTLMLSAARSIHEHARAKTWGGEGSERMLDGATVVIVGTGGIGSALAAMLTPLRAEIIGVNRSGRSLEGAVHTVPLGRLPELLPAANYVVLAAALTEETRHLVDASFLEVMASDAWVVNVGRGALIVTDDLVAVLTSRKIGGAALDVTDPEPLPDGHKLWDLDNVLITPHVANTWAMALPELRALIRRNVDRFERGEELEGLVDPELGY